MREDESVPTSRSTDVYVEVGQKKVFAAALEWPGWSRSGKDEERALDVLAAYLPRYTPVVNRAGLTAPSDVFTVVERVAGNTSTDFGVLDRAAEADRAKLTAAPARRLAALVAAAWDEFADIVATTPAELTKGPRGGGRDRDKIAGHVIGAEASYARKLGVRHKPPDIVDAKAIAALRADIIAALSQPWPGGDVAPGRWSPHYAARRIAWHVLDHAWEMQDRTPA
jgi:hypothetical protein